MDKKSKYVDINNVKIIATNGYIPVIDYNDGCIIYLVKLPYWDKKQTNGNIYQIHKSKIEYNEFKNAYYFRYVNGLRYYLDEFIKTENN